jgi:hypothetical protein
LDELQRCDRVDLPDLVRDGREADDDRFDCAATAAPWLVGA